jgi:hypothetical protein
MVRQAGTPNEDNESRFDGYPRSGDALSDTSTLSGIKPVRHFHVFVETRRGNGRARRPAAYERCMTRPQRAESAMMRPLDGSGSVDTARQ